jgi:hypothetical protein
LGKKRGTEGNKTADQLAKRGSLHPFIGLEPTYGISDRVAMQVIRTVCAESTRSTGSPSQDKDTQKAFFLSSLLKGILSF